MHDQGIILSERFAGSRQVDLPRGLAKITAWVGISMPFGEVSVSYGGPIEKSCWLTSALTAWHAAAFTREELRFWCLKPECSGSLVR